METELAVIVHVPNQHSCHKELEAEFPAKDQFVGTVARCSCGSHYIVDNSQRDGNFWTRTIYRTSMYDR